MSAKTHPVVLRFEGLRPEQLVRVEMHRKRNQNDEKADYVDRARTHLNKVLIGGEDWIRKAHAEIDEMRMENYADELEKLKKRKRAREMRQRVIEGPKDPWRPTKHGPMREVILTAHADYFDGDDDLSTFRGMLAKRRREKAFEKCAVGWLKSTFGDDVIHARCDRDEKAYHIHAVILPRSTDRHGRRVLQPSKFPEIADYELAQTTAGIWFTQVNLTRGEDRAHASRVARWEGKAPPNKVYHKRTAQWRKEQDIVLARKQKTLEARAVALTEKEAGVQKRELEADAVIAVADGLADGDFELRIDEKGTAPPDLVETPSPSEPDRQEETGLRMFFSATGKTRATTAFARAWKRLRQEAEATAEARFKDAFEEIETTRDALSKLLAGIPARLKQNLEGPAKTLAASYRRLKTFRNQQPDGLKNPSSDAR